MSDPIIVLSVDPGIDQAGMALLVDGDPVFSTSFGVSKLDGLHRGEKMVRRIQKIRQTLDDFMFRFEAIKSRRSRVGDPGLDLVAVEFTDWHQNLRRGDWQVQYARERRAQAVLAFYETTLACFALDRGIEFMTLGVTQWHKAWGASGKAPVAKGCATMWPNKIEWKDETAYWVADGHRLSDHETDAMAIGYVGFTEYRLLKKMRDSEI
jgi:hypothetical protein